MSGVVVDDGHEVVADVTLLLVALRVPLLVGGHQGSNVENNLITKKRRDDFSHLLLGTSFLWSVLSAAHFRADKLLD